LREGAGVRRPLAPSPKHHMSRATTAMPSFSRAQLGIILILGAVLLGLYGWRAKFGPGWPSLAVKAPAPVFVEVAGEVARPGVYAFPAPPTLPAVWRQAGGPEPPPSSDLKLTPGSRLEVTQGGKYTLGRISGPRIVTLGLAIEINTATPEDLEGLPGIGPVLAGRIVEYRKAHGPFRQTEELLAVSGIGPKKLEKLKPFILLENQGSSVPPLPKQ